MLTRSTPHPTDASTLDLQDVTVTYGSTVALEQVSVRIEAGEQVAVVGPNGAGKSTLFNIIAGTIRPSRGRVRVFGSGPSGHICIGYVPQRNTLDMHFPVTVSDVVMMGRVGQIGLFRWPSRRDQALVQEALARVGMQAFAKRQIGELSGGQQQRVFLARALAQGAELLLLDEPLTGLDLPSQDAILRILDELRADDITILTATHDLNRASEWFDTVMLLNRRLIAFGPPRTVLTAENLSIAYGTRLHVLPSASDTAENLTVLADTCCDCGDEHHPTAAHRATDPEPAPSLKITQAKVR